MFGYNDYGYGDYNHGRGYSSRSTTINAELQSQLEIKIKARTSSSQKMDFTFKPSMLVSSNLTGSASSSSSLYGQYGYSSGRSGSRSGSRSTIYLPITHLVSKIFPKYVKQYKLTLPANSSLIFIDEAEYQRYINYANGLIYPDEDVSVGKSQHHQLKSVYVIDDDVEMINQNISFIVNKLFNENRIISNITGRPELGSGLGPQPDRVNQEYYIETFFIPSAMSQQNKQIYTDAAVKIAEYLKEEKELRSQIDTDKKGLASHSSNSMTPQDRTKLTIGIARKEMKRQKLIAQRVAYEYGQATNYNLQQLKSKEKKLTTDIKETNRIIANLDREVASSYDRTMHHDKSHYTQRLAQYKRELAETKSVLESMKLRMYLITITDMVLIPKILNNGKENPQFAVLYNQFISRDRTLGADAGRIGVGEESAWFMPTRAKCDAGKKEIESMYNEIVRDAMNTFRHEMIDNDSAHIGSEAISRATEKPPPTEPGMIEEMKTEWMNMGKNNSAEYFKENRLDRAPSEEVFRATLESGEDPPESEDNKAVAALVRTKMGAYPVVFMLFGTPKLYRPTPSKTPSSSNIVNVVREPPQPKQDGGMKMKIQGLGLILNPTTVPPHFFTLKGDPAEYNKFKTVEIPYANVKIMDLTGTFDTAATPAVLVVPATPDAAVSVPVSDASSFAAATAANDPLLPDQPPDPANNSDSTPPPKPSFSSLLSSSSKNDSEKTAFDAANEECKTLANFDALLEGVRDTPRNSLSELKKTKLYAYYKMFIKPRLFNVFPGCYINENNDVATNRYIFVIAKGFTTESNYNDAIKTLEAIIGSDDLCKKPDSTSAERKKATVNSPFETSIRDGTNTINQKFVKKENDGSGDCLFLTLLELLKKAKPDVVSNLNGTDDNAKAQTLREELVDFISSDVNTSLQYGETGFTHDEILRVGGVVVNGGNVLYKNSHNPNNDYTIVMKRPDTYGTDLEISGAANKYSLTIYVVNSSGINFDSVYVGDVSPHTWYIYNNDGIHYMWLEPEEEAASGSHGGGDGRHSRRMRKIKKTHRSTRTRHPYHS